MAELSEIKKLDPAKRAQKLKELIEERNKEIEEAKKLAEKAERETADIIALRERIEVPELEDKAPDISGVFDEEDDKLTQITEEAVAHDSAASLYQVTPEMPTDTIYQEVFSLYNSAMGQGNVTADMASQAGAIQYAIAQKQQDIDQGNYSPDNEAIRQANTIKTIADKILSLYTANVKRKDGI